MSKAGDQADDRFAVAARQIVPARQIPRRQRHIPGAPVLVRQGGRDPRGRTSGIGGIDMDAGLAEHLAENGGIGGDDRQAGILRLQQGQPQAFVMGGADEQVGGVEQLIDPVGGLISVQRNARLALKRLPVVAPTRSADDVQRRFRKSVHAQRVEDVRRRPEILARLHRAERDQPKRLGLRAASAALPGVEAEHVADRRPIERHFGIGPAMRGKFALGVAGIGQKARVVAQRELEGPGHVEPCPHIELGAPRDQEIIVDIGQHPRCERPQQRTGRKAGTQQDRGRSGEPHRQAQGLRRQHLAKTLRLHRHDIERRKCGLGEQLQRDALKAGDVTSEMGVVDIDGHAKGIPS